MADNLQKDKLRLHHILEAIEATDDFLAEISKDAFDGNYEKQSAVIRQFEIIGEAASHLTPEFKKKYVVVDWPKVVGMRHKMIHDYFEVDTDIVWITAQNDLPILKKQIKEILKDLP